MNITMDLLAEQPLVQNGQTPHYHLDFLIIRTQGGSTYGIISCAVKKKQLKNALNHDILVISDLN